MADLGEKIDDIEGIADKRFALFGLSFTPTQLGAAFAILSATVGTLYSGFLMYQKVEEVAGLDIGAFEQRMDLIEQKLDAIDENTDRIKIDLKQQIERIQKTSDNSYDFVRDINLQTSKELRNIQVEMKQIKRELEERIQKALDNPLAN